MLGARDDRKATPSVIGEITSTDVFLQKTKDEIGSIFKGDSTAFSL